MKLTSRAYLVGAVAVACVLPAQARPQTRESIEMQNWRELVLNSEAIKPALDLREWKGVKCRVHLKLDFNPRADSSSTGTGSSFSGLKSVNEYPAIVEGVLALAGEDALVVSGLNGHVWVPRSQIRAAEVVQDPPTSRPR
jgi:hypothetical protein